MNKLPIFAVFLTVFSVNATLVKAEEVSYRYFGHKNFVEKLDGGGDMSGYKICVTSSWSVENSGIEAFFTSQNMAYAQYDNIGDAHRIFQSVGCDFIALPWHKPEYHDNLNAMMDGFFPVSTLNAD
ncbi:MAG: hypothetical protein AB8B82_14330 [Roseovarius sp.]